MVLLVEVLRLCCACGEDFVLSGNLGLEGFNLLLHLLHGILQFAALTLALFALLVGLFDTTSKWFGVTYAADREATVQRIKKLVDEGVYPNKLF